MATRTATTSSDTPPGVHVREPEGYTSPRVFLCAEFSVRPTVYPKPCPGCARVLDAESYSLKKAGGTARRGRCVDCCRTEKNEYRKRNPRKSQAAYRKEYYARKALHPEFNRQIGLRRNYGLTIADYDAMLAAQGGVCAICGTDDPHGKHARFHVDHCHISGVVRGLLCNSCNTAVGLMADEPARLRKAAQYLETSRGE